uniref:Uncharacterized protein n=1 Tax=Rhizophora mucronata TaxID=61149 RepID=A0A2P2PK73_RHIMU
MIIGQEHLCFSSVVHTASLCIFCKTVRLL